MKDVHQEFEATQADAKSETWAIFRAEAWMNSKGPIIPKIQFFMLNALFILAPIALYWQLWGQYQ